MVQIKTQLADKSNYGNKRLTEAIKFIVIHFTANDGDSDESNARYFATHEVKSSAHYFVDSDSITQSVPDNYVAYAVGANFYYHDECRNYSSISIELCDDNRDGTIYPSERTIQNAIELTRSLMVRYNVPIENVLRHYDVTHKLCPKYWVDDPQGWIDFKNRIIGGNEMNSEERAKFNALVDIVDEMRQREEKIYHYTNELPNWARPTIQKLLDKGIFKGESEADLNLPYSMMRIFVSLDRANLFN